MTAGKMLLQKEDIFGPIESYKSLNIVLNILKES
jgi:hypothetical protein